MEGEFAESVYTFERLENWSPQFIFEIDLTFGSVVEFEPNSVAINIASIYNSGVHRLLERFYLIQRLPLLGKFPVLKQFFFVQLKPL